MPGGDVLIPGTTLLMTLATTFFSRHERELTAALTVVLTLAIAVLTDRWVARRAARLSRLATGVLASSAIVAAIVGFAARQTLANLVAGVMLMIAQPLRIGDQVTIEDDTGLIEDVRLNYTVLRTGEGRRVFVPNERLASGVLRNDTIIDADVSPEVSLWLPLAGDTERAVAVAAAVEPQLVARAAEITPEGVRIAVTGAPVHAAARAAREAELRLALLRALRSEGLLGQPSEP
jgi:small-conductance mechanosensitive channel